MADLVPVILSGAVEGPVDETVLRRLVAETDAVMGTVYGKAGKLHLRERLSGYNQAAHHAPWVVLVDLDTDEDCAPPLCGSWLPRAAPQMCFRVAVREIEAWLLGDRERLARFLHVPIARMPHDPESLPSPKRTVVDIAVQSRRRDIRQDMVPRSGSGRSVGPAYPSRIIEFATAEWRPEVAAQHCDSLRRCRNRIAELVRRCR